MDDKLIFRVESVAVSVSCLATKHKQDEGKRAAVWSTKVTVRGGSWRENSEEWELTIPLKDIVDVHHGAYYACGIKFNDRAVVGIRANIEGEKWDYGIVTSHYRHSEKLFEMIQQARVEFDASSEPPPSYEDLQQVVYPSAPQAPKNSFF